MRPARRTRRRTCTRGPCGTSRHGRSPNARSRRTAISDSTSTSRSATTAVAFCFFAVRVGAKQPAKWTRYVARARARASSGSSAGDLALTAVHRRGHADGSLPSDLLDGASRRDLRAYDVIRRAPSHRGGVSRSRSREAHLARAAGSWRRPGEHGHREPGRRGVGRRAPPPQPRPGARGLSSWSWSSGLSVNVDLIYGLPGQTEASFRRDLEAVAAAGVHSLCLYVLRLNEHTPVAARLARRGAAST